MKETIDCLCNECGFNRFTVIKPKKDLNPSHSYFTCPECIREFNRKVNYPLKMYIRGVLDEGFQKPHQF